ncbi:MULTISPECIES: DUF4232 domain-containing protein [unclassified Streptomyces]|uniref:DUF4232 domain-containing protein n=1 Tax=unclassified Streptomyces TaxID=2593676 RepID=UPI0037AB065A
MRAIPLTVTTLAAALLLTACNDGGGSGGKNRSASGCAVGKVSVQAGSASVAPAAGDTGEVVVSITNQSAPCTLDGFPHVEVNQPGTTVTLKPQKGAKAQTLKLAKGDSATFTVTYVRGKDGDGKNLKAESMNVVLPGSDVGQSIPWKYGPIAGKTSQGDPEASVSAFQQAGD